MDAGSGGGVGRRWDRGGDVSGGAVHLDITIHVRVVYKKEIYQGESPRGPGRASLEMCGAYPYVHVHVWSSSDDCASVPEGKVLAVHNRYISIRHIRDEREIAKTS